MDEAIHQFLKLKVKNHDTYDDIYSGDYTYDHMKIITVLSQANEELTYEDLCYLAIKISGLWNASYTYKYNKNKTPRAEKKVLENDDFYMCQTTEEDGYSQAYAARVRDKIIKAYKEVYDL